MVPAIESIQQVGCLPVFKSLCDRLGLEQLIDECLPLASRASAKSGVVFVSLLMNRLVSPRPLYKLVDWAEQWGLKSIVGIEPEILTDDRVGRLLDSVAESADKIRTALFLRAIEVFGLDVSKLHWDLSSIRVEGDYEDQDEVHPTITYGYDPDGTGKYKQLRVANLVCGDGAVPVFHQLYSGNRNDVNTALDCLPIISELRKVAGTTSCLIGDTKLISPSSMPILTDAEVHFICPEAHGMQLDAEYLALSSENWAPLNYFSERQANLPLDARTRYRFQETTFQLCVASDEEPPVKTGKGGRPRKAVRRLEFRRLFVHSSEEEKAQRANRARRMHKIEQKLAEQSRKFLTPYWRKQSEASARRALEKLTDSATGKLFSTEIALAPDGQGWTLTWALNSKSLADAEALDGYYTLATNVPKDCADAHEIFRDYKAQAQVERRFADWKGPLKLRPVFLKNNQRIAGLVVLLSAALMVFSLFEREARLSISEPNGKIAGLYPENRLARPTGRNMIDAMSSLCLATFTYSGKAYQQLCASSTIQKRLLEIFRLDYLLQSIPQGP